jgi:GT2 family glycosyltransferase
MTRDVEQLRAEKSRDVEQLHSKNAGLIDRTILSEEGLFVSIIIVNYNGRHHLEKCLPSVFETRGAQFEVIVVDNGSSDDSVAWMREHWPQVRVIAEQRNLGFGRANLVGVHAAKSNYVALLNSDTVVTPAWLAQLVHPLLVEPGIGAACSQLRLLARPELVNARGGGMSRLGFSYDVDFGFPFVAPASPEELAPVDVLFPSGAAMLMRKPEFLDIGAFDPAFFMYHEDVDLGWRIWLLGKRVVMCPGSIVFHAFGGTTKTEMGASWRDWMGNRHDLRSLWKNYELHNALVATGQLVLLWLRTGQPGLALHALGWNLLHIRGTWRERRRLQRLRKVSDTELFARGLITEAVPPVPTIPPPGPKPDSGGWIAATDLWPGRSSAIGRLGPGWYAPERLNDEPVRATCGIASVLLQVSPNAAGTLALEFHVPEHLRGISEITVGCNDVRRRFSLENGAFWKTVEMPVQAGEDGLLLIEIESTTWRPDEIFKNGDLRQLGCVVRHIAFCGEMAATPYDPGRVTVIITTFNRWPVLQLTLAALIRQTWKDFEVIVVDDGSSDGTWEHLQKWREEHPGSLGLKIFTQENTGQGIARNNGLRHAEGDLVLFMGDDIIPEPDFIRQHILRHREVGMPCAVVGYTDWDRSAMRVTPLLEHVNEAGHQFGYRYMKDGDDVPYTCFYTSNVSLPRDVLGPQPFDPEFLTYGWEDVEVGYQLSKRGLRIVFNRLACAQHLHAMNLNDFYRRQVKVGGTISAIYAMHPELMFDQPVMPPARPPGRHALARHVVPLLLPLLNWLDSRSVRLPVRIYNVVLNTGFWIGRSRRA